MAGHVEAERLAVAELIGDEPLGPERREHAQDLRDRFASAGPSTGAVIRQRGGFPGASAASRVYVPSVRAMVRRPTRLGSTARIVRSR